MRKRYYDKHTGTHRIENIESHSHIFNKEYAHRISTEAPEHIEGKHGEEWMMKLKNSDGTTGAHWTKEQTDKVFMDNKIKEKSGDKISSDDFYYTLNMIYSDYGKALRENNAATIQIYIALAMAFLLDSDASNNKLSKYFYFITE